MAVDRVAPELLGQRHRALSPLQRLWRQGDLDPAGMAHEPTAGAFLTSGQSGLKGGPVKGRDEHLSEAKQRALIRVSMGGFTHAVRGLRADLAEHPLTKGVISSEQALRGFRASMDATLGRGSQALIKWIEDLR